VPASPRLSVTRSLIRGGVVAAVALTTAVTLVGGATSAPARATKHAPKPGLAGSVITLANKVSFDGDNRAYDLGSDKSGTTYVGWISSSNVNPGDRQIHLCTLPLHATGCKGGIQTADSPAPSTAEGLRVLVSPTGLVTLLWYYTQFPNGGIAETTSQSGGPLTTVTTVASAPVNGGLLDAERAPNGSIWTVALGGSSGPLAVREGLGNAPVSVPTSDSITNARLAFSGSTPIIVTDDSFITHPGQYAYGKGGGFSAFKNVSKTWEVGTNLGLTSTSSGVYVTTAVDNADYSRVIAKWNGHGFTKPVLTGDLKVKGTPCTPSSHATQTDASGRVVDATYGCGKVEVSTLGSAKRSAAIFSIPAGGTTAGGFPQVATLPRGYGWVAWSTYATGNTSDGDRLRIAPILVAGLHHGASKHGKHGTVSLSGPATCLPADALTISAKGHAAKGWKAGKGKLRLGKKKVSSPLNGASLKAGKKYTLKGTVVFSKGGSHETVTATLKFKACPNP
jgi:hypothetical protein